MGGKTASEEEVARLKRDLGDSEERYEELSKEARRLRSESDKKSAGLSDNRAYAELVES
jgi:archaellum component FlaC